jgi:hypothetical protein
MTVFFVNGPNQIFSLALPLLEEKQFKNLKIITTKELASFFKEHTNANVIVPNVHPNLITHKSKIKIFSNLIRAKIEYKKIFKNITNEDVYVFFTSWSVVFFSFIKKLSKRNKIYFLLEEDNIAPNFEDSSSVFKKERSLRAFVMRIIAKYFLGVDVFITNRGDSPIWELKRDSFPMKILKNESKLKNVKKYFLNNELFKKKDILFLGQDLSYVSDDEKSIIKLTDYIFEILDKNYSQSYLIKTHPRDVKLYGKIAKSKHVLPSHIMAEMLMGHDWKYIIGYYSGSLISAKKNSNAKVISLLNLWDWSNPKLKQTWLNEFKENGILLPQNLKELQDVLKK